MIITAAKSAANAPCRDVSTIAGTTFILTDNGSEFKNPGLLEKNLAGKSGTKLFYCDPMASWHTPFDLSPLYGGLLPFLCYL